MLGMANEAERAEAWVVMPRLIRIIIRFVPGVRKFSWRYADPVSLVPPRAARARARHSRSAAVQELRPNILLRLYARWPIEPFNMAIDFFIDMMCALVLCSQRVLGCGCGLGPRTAPHGIDVPPEAEEEPEASEGNLWQRGAELEPAFDDAAFNAQPSSGEQPGRADAGAQASEVVAPAAAAQQPIDGYGSMPTAAVQAAAGTDAAVQPGTAASGTGGGSVWGRMGVASAPPPAVDVRAEAAAVAAAAAAAKPMWQAVRQRGQGAVERARRHQLEADLLIAAGKPVEIVETAEEIRDVMEEELVVAVKARLLLAFSLSGIYMAWCVRIAGGFTSAEQLSARALHARVSTAALARWRFIKPCA
jgi:hypothetical protein